jgi:hypothetical protein
MWAGVVVAAGAVVGLAVYFAVVGLAQAEKIATVLGLFVALAGVALTIPGVIEIRRSRRSSVPQEIPEGRQGSTGQRSVQQFGKNNIYSEGPSHINIRNQD